MPNEVKLGKLAGLNLTAAPSALISFLLAWALLSACAAWLLNLPIPSAIGVGLTAAVLHWCGGLLHQTGHAYAARRTGYPMTGIQMWGALGASIYPTGEPTLPAEVHIRRALGGPIRSLLVALIAGAILLALSLISPERGVVWWLTLFFFLDNLLVFTIGALMPLGFTDGTTILHWRNKRT